MHILRTRIFVVSKIDVMDGYYYIHKYTTTPAVLENVMRTNDSPASRKTRAETIKIARNINRTLLAEPNFSSSRCIRVAFRTHGNW